jgi:hypothetical protein
VHRINRLIGHKFILGFKFGIKFGVPETELTD